ncbi:hypothetical protein J1N35_025589, partial [Gossypium stocksii]
VRSEEWEAFQSKWKQSVVFSIPTKPSDKDNDGCLVDVEQNPKGHPQTDKVPIEPTDQP